MSKPKTRALIDEEHSQTVDATKRKREVGNTDGPRKKVAIACQGGGSHAAFVAGILRGLFAPDNFGRIDLVGLSGTSGGALCAALAWSRMIDKRVSDLARRATQASVALDGFWDDLCCDDFWDVLARLPFPPLWEALTPQRYGDALINATLVGARRLPFSIEVSPYWYPQFARQRMEQLLCKHLPLSDLAGFPDADLQAPALFIAVTDITLGVGLALPGEVLRGGYDALIASASVPPLYRAVTSDHHAYWDGLFSRNPPIREFTNLPWEQRPDEIWVIQVSPQSSGREPTTPSQIEQRRTELSGNLALGQELYYIDKFNQLLEEYEFVPKGGGEPKYKHINLRVVGMRKHSDVASYYDRDRTLIKDLMREGEERAAEFFEERSLWSAPKQQSLSVVSPSQHGAVEQTASPPAFASVV
jgi:NTE family protein